MTAEDRDSSKNNKVQNQYGKIQNQCGDMAEFKNKLPKGRRLMGLDIGRNTIGVALSDRDWFIATPKFTLRRTNNLKDVECIVSHITGNGVGGIVAGLPLNSAGEETKSSIFVRQFLKILMQHPNLIDLPLYLHNEYLTSFEAEDFLIDQMATKYEKTRKIVDKVAASYILRDVLELLK